MSETRIFSVIGVRFRKIGKIYYFDPGDFAITSDTDVIVETARGIEFGRVVMVDKHITEEDVGQGLKSVIRIATEEDAIHHKENCRKEEEAFEICMKKIKEHKLKMKLVDVEYTFDNNKILFYFSADGRVDFRELVKDLASVFRTRIELRQIGVRDESKMLGGIGVCGRTQCCCTHLSDFQPVSISMAKCQGLSLNPTKISGTCGRLMCCLKYEQDAYEEIINRIPGVGAIVSTPDGQGLVIGASVLKELIKVKLDKESDTDVRIYNAGDLTIIKAAVSGYDMDMDIETLKKLED